MFKKKGCIFTLRPALLTELHHFYVILLLAWQGVRCSQWVNRSPMNEVSQKLSKEYNSQIVDIKNRTLNVLVHEMVPYTLLIEDDGRKQVAGFIGELWKVLEAKLGFRSEYKKVSFSEGKRVLSGGGADVMLSPVVLETKNLNDFDAVGPVASTIYSIYTRAPDDYGSSSSYLWTWRRELWLAYLGILGLCTLLLWVIYNVRNRCIMILTSRMNKNSDSDCNSLGNCCLIVLKVATQQGVQVRTKVCSTRAVMLVLLLFTYLMNTSYTSVLVSRLTVADYSYRIPSIEAIPASSAPFLCVRINSGVYSMFQVNTSSGELELLPMWKPVMNQGPCHPTPLNTDHVAANICQRDCFIFESDNIMTNLLSKGVHDCVMVRLRIQRIFSQISLLVHKSFRFQKLLKVQIIKMKQSGILHLLEMRYLNIKYTSTNAQGYPEVTISHVKSVLVVYGGVVLISLVLLAIELSIHYKQLKNKTHHTKNSPITWHPKKVFKANTFF